MFHNFVRPTASKGAKVLKQEFIECVKINSPHLKHSNIRTVWCGGQVAAARHWMVRRLHVQLASQDTFVIELLLTHTVQKRKGQLQSDDLLQANRVQLTGKEYFQFSRRHWPVCWSECWWRPGHPGSKLLSMIHHHLQSWTQFCHLSWNNDKKTITIFSNI